MSLDGGLTYLATGSVATSACRRPSARRASRSWTDGTFVLNDTWSAVGAELPDGRRTRPGRACPCSAGRRSARSTFASTSPPQARRSPALTATVRSARRRPGRTGRTCRSPVGRLRDPQHGRDRDLRLGTLVVGDSFRLKTSAPFWDTTGLAAARRVVTAVVGCSIRPRRGPGPIARARAPRKTWPRSSHGGEYVFAQLGCRDQITGESITTWSASIQGHDPRFSGYDGEKHLDVCASHGYVANYLRAGVYFAATSPCCARAPRVDPPCVSTRVAIKSGKIRGLMPDTDALAGVIHDLATYTSINNARFSGAQQVKGARAASGTSPRAHDVRVNVGLRRDPAHPRDVRGGPRRPSPRWPNTSATTWRRRPTAPDRSRPPPRPSRPRLPRSSSSPGRRRPNNFVTRWARIRPHEQRARRANSSAPSRSCRGEHQRDHHDDHLHPHRSG